MLKVAYLLPIPAVIIYSKSVFSTPTLLELLSNTDYSGTPIVVFEKNTGTADRLSQMQLHFLKAEDCYSGYSGVYITSEEDSPFLLEDHRTFPLSATATYQAGLSSLGQEKISQMHSVLIRLMVDKKTFSQFTGSCNDQGINCCIPIDCLPEIAQCTPKSNMGIQTITVNNPASHRGQVY